MLPVEPVQDVEGGESADDLGDGGDPGRVLCWQGRARLYHWFKHFQNQNAQLLISRENFSHLSRVDFLDNVKTFLMEDFNSIKAEYWNTVPTQKCKKNWEKRKVFPKLSTFRGKSFWTLQYLFKEDINRSLSCDRHLPVSLFAREILLQLSE